MESKHEVLPQVFTAPVGEGRRLEVVVYPQESEESQVGLQPVVFLLDTSGSMGLHAALLEDCIRYKLPLAGIKVIIFSSNPHVVEPESDGSVDWKKIQNANGAWMCGTNYELALEKLYTEVTSPDSRGVGNDLPIIIMLTDGLPESGDHKAASARLKKASVEIRCAYFGRVTLDAHKTLSAIGTGTPHAIQPTSEDLEKYVLSVLRMRVRPQINHSLKTVSIGGMAVSIQTATEGIVAADRIQDLPARISLEMAVQLATTLIYFLRTFGSEYRTITQAILRVVGQRVSPYVSSGAKGVKDLYGILVGDALQDALQHQRSQPLSSEKNYQTLMSMVAVTTGRTPGVPNDPFNDFIEVCANVLAQNPPPSFRLPTLKKAQKVILRTAMTADKKAKAAIPQIKMLLDLPFPRELLTLSLDPSLAARLASPEKTDSAAAISAAGNSPFGTMLVPGRLWTQNALDDLKALNEGAHLILLGSGTASGAVTASGAACGASFGACMAQINPYSSSMQANLAPATLVLYRHHTPESAGATLIVLQMLHIYLASLPTPYFTMSPTLFDYGYAARLGKSPIVHALRSYFQQPVVRPPSAQEAPQLEMMLLFLHQVDLTFLDQTRTGGLNFVCEKEPSREDVLRALESPSERTDLGKCFGKVWLSLSDSMLSDDLVDTLEESIRKDHDAAAARAPTGIWPSKFSAEDMVRLLRLVDELARGYRLDDKEDRDRLAAKTLLLPSSPRSLSTLLSHDPVAREAFFLAILLLYAAHQLIGPNQSAPDIHELFRITGAESHPGRGVSLARLFLTSTGPSQSVLAALMTKWFLEQVEKEPFTADQLALFSNLVDAKHLLIHVQAIVADHKVATVRMATCVQFMKHGSTVLVPFVGDISVQEARLLNQGFASQFLCGTRLLPEGKYEGAIVVLLTKATNDAVVHYISNLHPVLRSSLFLSVTKHPLEGFRRYLDMIAEDAKTTPEVALALLKYNTPTVFRTWGPDRLEQCLVLSESSGTPSDPQRELLATLDMHAAADTLPNSEWRSVLPRINRRPYENAVVEIKPDDAEVARRWAIAASSCMLPPTGRLDPLQDEAILSWMRPSRLCNFHELRDIISGNESASVKLDRIVHWRRGRCTSPEWTARSKLRLERHTLLLSLMRVAQWSQDDQEWQIPTKIIVFSRSAQVVVHPDSNWVGTVVSKSAKQP